jgi:hypothetical protein
MIIYPSKFIRECTIYFSVSGTKEHRAAMLGNGNSPYYHQGLKATWIERKMVSSFHFKVCKLFTLT